MARAGIRHAKHQHAYHPEDPKAEKRTWIVVGITATMMIAEIAAGLLFGSMAVYADGWHMSTHALALGITAIAYRYARKWATDVRFTFGPWKVEALGGYTSAIILVLVALAMIWQSVQRLYHPARIRYTESLIVAIVGLAANIASALILREDSGDASQASSRKRKPRDLNLKAAYLHVLADATTSLLAILALVVARTMGAYVLDPIMGIVGGLIICAWGFGLLRDTSGALLDRETDHGIVAEIRDMLESDGSTKVDDLHVWRIGRSTYACAVSVVTATRRTAEDFRNVLESHGVLAHTTIEVTHRGTGYRG